jgi:hypothetical protein
MNLNNLSMNYKIILGISTVTILTLIYQYVKNIFNPNKRLLEGVVNVGQEKISSVEMDKIVQTRYGPKRNNNNTHGLSKSSEQLNDQINLLKGIYDELGEFNHIYQERMFEQLIPSQIKKTIIHLSSIDHINDSVGSYVFDLASTGNSGLRKFNNVINLKLLSAQIPYIPHNIYLGNNNNNQLKFDTNLSIITIPEGKYTIYSLINKINTLLTAASQSITLSFDPITYFISIENSTGSDITIDINYPLFLRLGFHTSVTIAGVTYPSTSIPDISIHYIDIISPDIHPRGATLTNNNSTILKRIPLTGQMGDLIYYEANYPDYISQELFMPDITANPSTFNVTLKRHDNTPYDLKKLHFDLKLEITELVEPTLINELGSHMRRDRERFLEKEGSTKLQFVGRDFTLDNE